MAAEGADQAAALQLFGELALRVGQAHAGFVAGAAASLAHIVKGGIDYALQVRTLHPLMACLLVYLDSRELSVDLEVYFASFL